MQSVYELNQIKKSYEGRKVLDIDHLTIAPGEIHAVVGPSGAGKSTLLRLMNFLEFPESGSLSFQGRAISAKEVPVGIRRQVTTVFQKPALLSMNVTRNIAIGLRLRGNRDSKEKINSAMERMGLTDRSGDTAHTLSGGEAQRVALARALVIEPAVLLLDEPTSNLDPYNIDLIETVVREMNQDKKTTVVLVTHNIFQARRLADRVTLLLNGRNIETADVETFFEIPQNEKTRAFVNGEMVY